MNKSNLGRIIFGFMWFFAGWSTLLIPVGVFPFDAYWAIQSFSEMAVFPVYREFIRTLILPNAVVVLILIAVSQIVSGVLILSKDQFVKLGLMIGIFFNLCFAFLAIEVIPLDLSLAAVQIYLLTKDYDTTFLEIFHTKFHS